MESPGGVTTVPAERIGMIHEEMVTQRRTGVKVKGYGLTLSSWGENGQLHIKKVFSSVNNYAQALASLPTPGVYFGPQIGWLGMPV